MKLGAYRISILYVVISFLWITLSDKILFLFQREFSPGTFQLIGSSKGIVFVFVTGFLLFRMVMLNNKKLISNENQYRIMYEESPLPMWIYDLHTLNIVSVNNAAVCKYGYTKEEFLAKTILDIRPEEDREKVLNTLNKNRRDATTSEKWVHKKADGTLFDVNVTTRAVTFGTNKLAKHIMAIAHDVTEAVAFEKEREELNIKLQKEKQHLSITQQIAKVGGWEFFPHNETLIFSDEMFHITGADASPDDNLFEVYKAHIHPDDRPAMIAALGKLLQYGESFDVTHRILMSDGSTRFIRQLARLDATPGRLVKVVGSAQDITEIKQLEHERNSILLSLENTLNNISEGFYAVDRNLVFTQVNKNFETELGIGKDEIIGKRLTDLFPGIEKRVTYAEMKKVLGSKVSSKFETYSPSFKKWLYITACPTNEGVAVYFNDITDRKVKDLQIKEAAERYEMVSKATQDVIYDYDILKNSIDYNVNITRLLNINHLQLNNKLSGWRNLIHAEDVDNVVTTQREALERKDSNWSCEYRVFCGEEGYKYVFDQGYFIYNEKGQAVRLIGAVKDIDALKRAGEENRRLAGVITRVNNLVVVTDVNNKLIWVNKAFEVATGYHLNEVIGKNPLEFLIGPESSLETVAYIKQAKQELKSFSVELVHYIKNGIPQWVNIAFTPMFDDELKFNGYIAVLTVITARKKREEYITRQNKILQEVAWLSSHEIRRPVASLLGLSQLYKEVKLADEREEIMEMIDKCACELDEIVHNITGKINDDLSSVMIEEEENIAPIKIPA